MLYYLSLLLGLPIYDAAGRRVGVVSDLSADFRPLFPRVLALGVGRHGRTAFFIPWHQVGAIGPRAVRLAVEESALRPVEPVEGEMRLGRQLLDRQIVDRHGRKVVRVNDLALARTDGELRLVAVDAGMRGMLRRLHWEGAFLAVAELARVSPHESLIPWNYVEPLERFGEVRLRITRRRLAELPATDLARIMEDLDEAGRRALLEALDDETLADALPEMEDDTQVEVMESLEQERASDILERMPPDDAADLLRDLPGEKADDLLEGMEQEEAEDVRDLLQYPEDSAGGIMTPDFIAIPQDTTVDGAIRLIRDAAPEAEHAYYLYVVDGAGHLRGVLSVRQLLTSAPDRQVAELMDADVVSVRVDDDQEEVARVISRYHFLALPVVDEQGVLRGIVTLDDALDVIRQESEEDLTRAAGTAREVEPGTPAAVESAWRLPWLLAFVGLGTVGALITEQFLLAGRIDWRAVAFLPLLIAVATLVGSQSSASIVRSLGLGEAGWGSLGRRWWQELLSGLVLGGIGGLLGAGLAWAWGAGWLAVSLLIAVPVTSLAVVVLGLLLPLVLSWVRLDPALALRPAMAVLALLAGVPIYLWVVDGLTR